MLRSRLRRWRALALFGLALLISCAGPLGPSSTLPIYRLATPVVTVTTAQTLGMSLTGTPGTVFETPDRFLFRSGDTRVEIYKASGGVWAEDSTALWNPDLNPVLLDTTRIATTAPQFVFNGRPTLEGLAQKGDSTWVMFESRGFGATLVTTRDRATRTSTTRKLDVAMNFGARVEGRRSLNRDPGLPTVGGGGEFKAIYGDQGRLIGFNGVWRTIERVERRERVIPLAKAQADFIAAAGKQIQSVEARLAYYSAPASKAQTFLYPVYVFRGNLFLKGKTYRMRDVLVPATKFKDSPYTMRIPSVPPLPRGDLDSPQVGSTNPEGPEEGGSGPAHAASDWREVGAHWQGMDTGGLLHSADNAMGFLDAMKTDGWRVNFAWGDTQAWYPDWIENRKDWVDAADIVFYSGHAGSTGWQVWTHNEGTGAGDPPQPEGPRYVSLVDESVTVANSNEVWGANDLECIVVSGCGPLQDDEVTPEDGSAIDRWDGAFGGLHLLLGFATESTDTADEGMLFAQYALAGETLVDAWFRATTESQAGMIDGKAVRAGAMWVTKTQKTPYFDKLWGYGDVAPDLKGADARFYHVMWTPL